MLSTDYDVAVIGAGIHGAGVAQAAAAAGHRVVLFDKAHAGAGTSSRSSKLVHGGLRYLETAQFGLVRESLRERELLLRLAPSLVHRVPFFLPVYADTSRRPWKLRAGLTLYRLLGGSPFRSLPAREWKDLLPLRQDGLQAVLSYDDARTDDEALVKAVVRSACSLGATFVAPVRVASAERQGDGYRLRYLVNGADAACTASVVVNAAGPWVEAVQGSVVPKLPSASVELVQGAHLVLDRKVGDGVFYVESPIDRRPVFVMPWKEGALVGTTETVFTGSPDAVAATRGEIAYLEETLRHYFPGYAGRTVDTFAGLRVLPRSSEKPQSRPRETMLLPDASRNPRWVAVYGGKLTTWRSAAAKVVRLVAPSLPKRSPVADTAELPLE